MSLTPLYLNGAATLTVEEPDPTAPLEQDLDSDDAAQSPDPISLKSINLISRQLPAIQDARTRINAEMENMVLSGLDSLVRQPNLNYLLGFLVSSRLHRRLRINRCSHQHSRQRPTSKYYHR